MFKASDRVGKPELKQLRTEHQAVKETEPCDEVAHFSVGQFPESVVTKLGGHGPLLGH